MAIDKTNRFQNYQSLLSDLESPFRIANFSASDSTVPPKEPHNVAAAKPDAVVDEFVMDDDNTLRNFKSLIG